MLALVRVNARAIWRQHGGESLAVESWRTIQARQINQLCDGIVQFHGANFLVRHFAALVTGHQLNFVSFKQETPRLLHANLNIMRIHFHAATQANFLHFKGLGLATLLVLLRLLVFVLSKIHDLADRRPHIGRDLHKVKTSHHGKSSRFFCFNNTKHCSCLVDQTNRRDANAIIDARTKIGTRIRS